MHHSLLLLFLNNSQTFAFETLICHFFNRWHHSNVHVPWTERQHNYQQYRKPVIGGLQGLDHHPVGVGWVSTGNTGNRHQQVNTIIHKQAQEVGPHVEEALEYDVVCQCFMKSCLLSIAFVRHILPQKKQQYITVTVNLEIIAYFSFMRFSKCGLYVKITLC